MNKFFKKFLKTIYNLMIICIIILFAFAIVQKTTKNKGSICGVKIFTVITGSMIPVYNIGDIIIVKEIDIKELKVDDDIVYEGEKGSYKNKTITHRVIHIEENEDGNYKIVTKGVANSMIDPEINQTQILGKVIGKIPIFNWILRVITNAYTWIIIPVILLIRRNLRKMKEIENT